jgi:glutathione S-transferase
MITVFGEGRGFRVVWLLEEMGLAYRLRPVDLLAGVEKDPEFLAINPGGFIPAIQDGDVTMVESIAIIEYLMALRADAARSGAARSRLLYLPTIPSSRGSWACSAH